MLSSPGRCACSRSPRWCWLGVGSCGGADRWRRCCFSPSCIVPTGCARVDRWSHSSRAGKSKAFYFLIGGAQFSNAPRKRNEPKIGSMGGARVLYTSTPVPYPFPVNRSVSVTNSTIGSRLTEKPVDKRLGSWWYILTLTH